MRQKPARMQASHPQNSRSGSIFVMILVFIALFAALSFTLLRGTRSGQANLDEQKAKLVAAEFLSHANKIKDAVKAMRISGCDDTEISFETDYTGTTYVNPDTRPDNSCKIFHRAGGKITYPAFSKEAQGALLDMTYTGRNDLDGIGKNDGDESSSDLAIIFTTSSKEVCDAYNKALGLTSLLPPPARANYTESLPFTGTYGPYRYVSASELRGKPTACYDSTVGVDIKYVMYHTLLAR